MYIKTKEYGNGKPILYGLNTMRAQYGVVTRSVDIQPDSDGNRKVPEGMFVVQVGNKARYLPRTRINAATATNSTQVVLKAPNSQFLVGDVLYAQAGFGEIVISGTVATGDTVTIRLDGVSYSVTVGATQTAAAVAALFVSEHAATLLADKGVTLAQKGSSSTLTLFATDAYKIDLFASNGATVLDLRTTESGYLGDHIVPLGTIASIALPAGNGTRTVTLAGNAAYVVPANCSVGVMVDKFLGIYPEPMDYTEDPIIHVAPIVAADGVYESNLPYVDGQLKRTFRELYINKYFYKNA